MRLFGNKASAVHGNTHPLVPVFFSLFFLQTDNVELDLHIENTEAYHGGENNRPYAAVLARNGLIKEYARGREC
jgi:hypothetical protein